MTSANPATPASNRQKRTVSVVMPAFNAGATIVASVRAVLGQQLDSNLVELKELIVVDDASTERPATDALAEVSDPRLRVIKRQANGGPAAARTTGVAEASGDILAFADADDLWLPGKLEAQCAAMRAHPTAGASYCWVDVVDRTGAVVFADQRARYEGDVYAQLLGANFIYSGSNLVVDRDAFDEAGGFNTSLRAVEDWELHVRLARCTHFVCVPEVLIHYRQRPGSLSGQLQVMEDAYVQARDGLFAEAPAELKHLRAHSSAAFYAYLCMRATQRGWSPTSWAAALRYGIKAIAYRPAVVVDVLRGRAPLASLRLSARELGKKWEP